MDVFLYVRTGLVVTRSHAFRGVTYTATWQHMRGNRVVTEQHVEHRPVWDWFKAAASVDREAVMRCGAVHAYWLHYNPTAEHVPVVVHQSVRLHAVE